MRISSFFENFNTKNDKLGGLTNIINEISTRFQELGTKVSFSPQNRSACFSRSYFQSGRNAGSKTVSPVTKCCQKSQRAQYVADIKKSLHPGVTVALQIFQAAEARLKMCTACVLFLQMPEN